MNVYTFSGDFLWKTHTFSGDFFIWDFLGEEMFCFCGEIFGGFYNFVGLYFFA